MTTEEKQNINQEQMSLSCFDQERIARQLLNCVQSNLDTQIQNIKEIQIEGYPKVAMIHLLKTLKGENERLWDNFIAWLWQSPPPGVE